MGQLADEADGVGEEIVAALMLVAASGRVERVEQAGAHAHLGAGERVQEGRLAGVRVARERDGWDRRCLASRAHRLPALLDVAKLSPQSGDPVAGEAAVRLDLGLARAPCADAAVHAPCAEPFEVRPQAAHPGEVVFELRQLDLELPLGRVRVVGEDVEDHRGPVDHRHVERRLEVSLLAWRQLVVTGDEVRAGRLDRLFHLGELASPQVAVRIGLGPRLDDLARCRDAGRPQKLLQLGERVIVRT